MDFLKINMKKIKNHTEVYPSFEITKSKDLMIRGGRFYAIWDKDNKIWSQDQDDVVNLIDKEIADYVAKHQGDEVDYIRWMRDGDSGSIDKWKKYTERQLCDNFVTLNGKLIFADTEVKREDYASIRLPYSLKPGKHGSYDKLMDVLYSPTERAKIEWGIGCVVAGEILKHQKFIVLTGDGGTGKGTVLKIIRNLFPGYIGEIDGKAMVSNNGTYALESLKDNPLVAIAEDTKLNNIVDNTVLNSLISHESMVVNAKYERIYTQDFRCFLFMGSNGEVEITDAMSGLTRRLIDVRPTGITIPNDEYNALMNQIIFELGAIAYHCKEVYKKARHKYDKYKPLDSLRKTNIFYSFLEDNYDEFKNGISLKKAYDLYQAYCEDNRFSKIWSKMQVKNELMAYYRKFSRERTVDYIHYKNYYEDFRADKFGKEPAEVEIDTESWLDFKEIDSPLDRLYSNCPAQYAKEDGSPQKCWDYVKTTLGELDPHKLHWFLLPKNVIKIDFDRKGPDGNKSLEVNIEAARDFPPTYGELSRSGNGIHLYYIWDGDVDVTKLAKLYDEDIEIKVSTGKASNRRILTKCNDLELATISSGLPIKTGGDKVLDTRVMQTEKGLRTTILRSMEKEYHGNTTQSINWIKEILDRANASDLVYDVSDLKQAVYDFASRSSNQAEKNLETVRQMKFISDKAFTNYMNAPVSEDKPTDYIIYDIEIKPNLLLICWKYRGSDVRHKMYNPTPKEVADLFGYEEQFDEFNIVTKDKRPLMVNFNGRNYDDHILLKRIYGGDDYELYMQSKAIITNQPGAHLREGYHLSDLDLYDIATKKQSLKKWEIDLGKKHLEMDTDWDEPSPVEEWEKLAEYCANDVDATEAVLDYLLANGEIDVRIFLAKLSGLTTIDTNRMHITRIIFGDEKYPDLCYTNLATGERFLSKREYNPATGKIDNHLESLGIPDNGLINAFPGYKFNLNGFPVDDYILPPASSCPKSWYMGEDPSEGGYVYSEPGMYYHVWCFDVSGMHPASIVALNKFSDRTIIFDNIRQARLAIKHEDYKKAIELFPQLDGMLNDSNAKAISNAFKLILNSTYGIGAATFENPLKDPADVDNIVAKRGALFMITLKNEVQKRGYKVVHCKTDSIKVVNPDDYISNFIFEFGKAYGYNFEIEHKFRKFCLVNKAVYIAENYEPDKNGVFWEATGAQFQHPYVFKKLFTHQDIVFDDLCETKSVTTAMYLDVNEHLPEGEHDYIFIGKCGSFCPVLPGHGGGLLYRKKEDKYYAVGGTSGYRWLETEMFFDADESIIDFSYFHRLAENAIDEISKYGDFEWFVNDANTGFEV